MQAGLDDVRQTSECLEEDMKIDKNDVSRSVFAAVSLAALAICIDAHADVVYNSLPTIVNPPTNTNPSYPYAATGTTEIGDPFALGAHSR